MKKLSLSVIAKNEEEMIETMLRSCEGVDEIVILDTGSTDKTVDIGRKYGTVLTHYKWNDNFSEARNECKKRCTGDWLLIVDCDEVLENPVSQLKTMINSAWTDKYDLLLFDVKTPLEMNEQPRLIRNTDKIWYYGAAHNIPRYYPEGLDKPEKAHMIPHDKAFKTTYRVTANVSPNHKRDPDRTLRILEKHLAEHPHDTRELYYYIREMLNRKDPYRALYYCERYCKIAKMTNERADVHFIAATCHIDLGDTMSAIDQAWNAVKILPTFRDAWDFLGQFYTQQHMREMMQKISRSANNKGVLFVRDIAKQRRPDMKVVKK